MGIHVIIVAQYCATLIKQYLKGKRNYLNNSVNYSSEKNNDHRSV